MTEPRRRYTKRQKVTAVIAAELTSQQQASETTGIPRTTIIDWMSEPWAVELRQKTRDDLAESARVLAHRVLAQIVSRLADFEPRDLSILFGVMVDKAQLLSGAATTRTESRDITGTLSDIELAAAIREADELVRRAAAAPAGAPEG